MSTAATPYGETRSDADRAAADALKAGCALVRRHGKFSIADYLALRHQSDSRVPTLANVCRLFGSFHAFLRQLEAKQTAGGDAPARIADERLIDDLRHVAGALGSGELSTGAYDHYREAHPTRETTDGKRVHLASSSVIRKRLGRWATAVDRAGLRAVSNAGGASLEVVEAIEVVRQAKAACGGRLTTTAYERVRAEEVPTLPHSGEIIALFSSWRAALTAAEVETGDAIRADENGSPWAASEIRHLVHQAEAVLQRSVGADYELEAEGWTNIRSASRRPLPSWDTVAALLRV